MKRSCVRCGHGGSWQLGDGRHKCRQCGHRQSFRSAWAACRLGEDAKRRLLEYFIRGVPAYRLRFSSPASIEATERFFRLTRRVLALAEGGQHAFDSLALYDEARRGSEKNGTRGPGEAGEVMVFSILLSHGRVIVSPVSERERAELLPLIVEHTKSGSLYYTDEWQAFASLAVRGGYVVVSEERVRPGGGDRRDTIARFWSYARRRLHAYRGVPKRFAHLYLAEMTFRFNHRDEDLFPLIYGLLTDTDTSRVR